MPPSNNQPIDAVEAVVLGFISVTWSGIRGAKTFCIMSFTSLTLLERYAMSISPCVWSSLFLPNEPSGHILAFGIFDSIRDSISLYMLTASLGGILATFLIALPLSCTMFSLINCINDFMLSIYEFSGYLHRCSNTIYRIICYYYSFLV